MTPPNVANRHLLLDDLQGVVQHFLGVAGGHAEADAGLQQSRGGRPDPHHRDPPLVKKPELKAEWLKDNDLKITLKDHF